MANCLFTVVWGQPPALTAPELDFTDAPEFIRFRDNDSHSPTPKRLKNMNQMPIYKFTIRIITAGKCGCPCCPTSAHLTPQTS